MLARGSVFALIHLSINELGLARFLQKIFKIFFYNRVKIRLISIYYYNQTQSLI